MNGVAAGSLDIDSACVSELSCVPAAIDELPVVDVTGSAADSLGPLVAETFELVWVEGWSLADVGLVQELVRQDWGRVCVM